MDKFNFTTKLHEVCSKDETNPVMNCIHFKDGFAYASNGMILIRQTLDYHSVIDPEFLNGNSIHRESFKQALSFDTVQCTDEGLVCKDKDGRVALFEYFDLQGKEIPNFDFVLRKPSADYEPVSMIGFNPEALSKLEKAMHYQGVLKFTFYGMDKYVFVESLTYTDQIAIMAPAIIQDTLF